MEYAVEIINILINKFEERGLYANTIGKRPPKIDIVDLFPDYMNQYSSDTFREINTSIEYLLSRGYVNGEKDARGYYSKLSLQFKSVPLCYQMLNRMPLGTVREQQYNIVSEINCEHPILLAFQQAQLKRLESSKPLEHGIKDSIEKLNNVLIALVEIFNLKSETFIRNFSEAVFQDSKRFQQIQNSVVSILCSYSEEVLTKENALKSYNLVNNPVFIYLKGQLTLSFQKSSLAIFDIPGGVALSARSIPEIKSITLLSDKLITVENLTTYHDEGENHEAVLYLGGFHNSIRTQLLKQIFMDNPDKQYFHKGDIDVYGFLILENLKEKTGIPFLPIGMDIETLANYNMHGLVKPLSTDDRKLMKSSKLSAHADVISYMDTHNIKAEQEAQQAIKMITKM